MNLAIRSAIDSPGRSSSGRRVADGRVRPPVPLHLLAHVPAERQLGADGRARRGPEDEVRLGEVDPLLGQAGRQPGLPGDAHRPASAQHQGLAHLALLVHAAARRRDLTFPWAGQARLCSR